MSEAIIQIRDNDIELEGLVVPFAEASIQIPARKRKILNGAISVCFDRRISKVDRHITNCIRRSQYFYGKIPQEEFDIRFFIKPENIKIAIGRSFLTLNLTGIVDVFNKKRINSYEKI